MPSKIPEEMIELTDVVSIEPLEPVSLSVLDNDEVIFNIILISHFKYNCS